MTPREVVDALDSAPRVAMPWKEDDRYARRDDYFGRYDTKEIGPQNAAQIGRQASMKSTREGNIETIVHTEVYMWLAFGIDGPSQSGSEPTIAAAKAAADAALVNAGWLLLD